MVGSGVFLLAFRSYYNDLYMTVAVCVIPLLMPIGCLVLYYFSYERPN